MRTTVRLPDDLLRRTKILAAERGTTLTALIEAGLERLLAEAAAGPVRGGVREEQAGFARPVENPLLTLTPYELPPDPGPPEGLLQFVSDPVELAKAIEYESDRASYIRSGGAWPA